jgi:16S rRNA (cytosine967-C5)-methyltransferase
VGARLAPARKTAWEILRLAEGGARSDDLLRARGARLDARDRALATRLVLGALRHQAQLDHLISAFSGKSPTKLDPEIRAILRLGVYQLRYLDRLPAHAVVDDSVELVRRAHKRSACGFVNAVLRKVDRREVEFPDPATEFSVPAWLLERWESRYGQEVARGIARAFLEEPETYVRCTGTPPAGADLEPTEVAGCFRLVSGEAPGLRVQDIGSQTIVPLLELRQGQRFLDVCAAPGNKTAQALESGVRAVACDRSARRLAALEGLPCDRVILDAARAMPFGRRFDRILVDAPCSGTGTLGRNPEIRWRLSPEDPGRHAERQRMILRNALEALAPGGRLVYSTCSLEEEENEAVVAAVAGSRAVFMRRIPGVDAGDGFFAAVIEGRPAVFPTA